MCNPDVNGVHAVKVELVLQGLDVLEALKSHPEV